MARNSKLKWELELQARAAAKYAECISRDMPEIENLIKFGKRKK